MRCIIIYNKILIGIDGSDDSFRAAKRALEFHKRDSSKVVAFTSLLHKLTYLSPPLITIPADNVISFHVQPERVTIAERALSKVKALFEDSNGSIETRVVYDKEPDDYIKEQVQEEGFDLVILGCNAKEVSKWGELKNVDIKSRFVIVDGKEMTFMLMDDSEVHESYDCGVWVNTSLFVSALQKAFEKGWQISSR